MRREVFLEYKFGDYDLELLKNSGANGLMVAMKAITSERVKWLKELGMRISVVLNPFEAGVCPLSPHSEDRLSEEIEKALSLKSSSIWLDHLRFDGQWGSAFTRPFQEKSEASLDRATFISGLHPYCKWCLGRNRAQEIADIAKLVRERVPLNVQLGYFAVPFMSDEVPEIVTSLGQNHLLLGQYFNVVSPMLYHRMINKPVSYISKYVRYLSEISAAKVLPIIAVKDMPDDLPDKLDEREMERSFAEALRPPSSGVAWFSWDGAVEKGKTSLIKKLFAGKDDE